MQGDLGVIDLHLHTTASDGVCVPVELVRRAREAGIRTLAVTDHDTMAAVDETTAAAAAHGLTCVPGIEVTAVADGRDVHVLGYFLRADAPDLGRLMVRLRDERAGRAREIVERLAALGVPVDAIALLGTKGAPPAATIARPQIAQALVRAGHVSSIAEAFDRFLSEGRAAYVPHRGPRPEEAVTTIVRAGGVASLAHPGPLGRDDLIPPLVEAGLGAIEAYHSDHDSGTTARYVGLARAQGLAVTGGSDYHGNGRARDAMFGTVTLPEADFTDLVARAGRLEVRP